MAAKMLNYANCVWFCDLAQPVKALDVRIIVIQRMWHHFHVRPSLFANVFCLIIVIYYKEHYAFMGTEIRYVRSA